MPAKTLRIKLLKSPIGCTRQQKATVAALGLRRIAQVVERPGTLETRGMVEKIRHLVEVTES